MTTEKQIPDWVEDLPDEQAQPLDGELEARVGELECYIERDKDGDGFINKDAMDLLFPDS